MVVKSIKIRLELDEDQTVLAFKHAGVARFAYNWGLEKCLAAHEAGEKRPSAIDLHKLWVAEFKPEHDWTYEVSKCAPQQAFRNLASAYERLFTVKGAGFPKFKKKGQKDSFYLDGSLQTDGKRIKLPVFGWLKTSEKLPAHPIKNVVVARCADHWFVSFKVEFTPTPTVKTAGPVGVDVGIKTLAVLSNGAEIPAVLPYRKNKRQLRLAQRRMSARYKKGVKGKEQTKGYRKARRKVARRHYKIACVRKDAIHKLTSDLAKNHSKITIEDLNVSGMAKNHKLASAILDGGFSEFRRQLEYKTAWYGSELVIAKRFYPSSKMCSGCRNVKKKLSLRERTYNCEACGLEIDRDLNAALNLEHYH